MRDSRLVVLILVNTEWCFPRSDNGKLGTSIGFFREGENSLCGVSFFFQACEMLDLGFGKLISVGRLLRVQENVDDLDIR